MFKKLFLYSFLSILSIKSIYANDNNTYSYDVIVKLKSNGVEKGFKKFEESLELCLKEGKKYLLVETGRGQFFKKFPKLLEKSLLRKFVSEFEAISIDGKNENAYALQLCTYDASFNDEVFDTATIVETSLPEKRKQKSKKSDQEQHVTLVSKNYVFPKEDELNLHSKSIKGAYDLVMNFIENAYNNRKKIVLVITGKGNHGSRYSKTPGYKIGKIRQAFPEWIKDERIKDLIEDVAQAQGVHGGEGAFYVVLK